MSGESVVTANNSSYLEWKIANFEKKKIKKNLGNHIHVYT